jgi:hypothetical protein
MEQQDYWPMSEIHGAGTTDQLRYFLLPHLDDLRHGYYPEDPRRIGRPGGGFNKNAKFVGAVDIAAEIDLRMDKIVDSIALILRYTAYPNWTLQDIARSLHYRDQEYLEIEMEYMLRYIAGRKRKVQTYPQWKATHSKRHKIYVKKD